VADVILLAATFTLLLGSRFALRLLPARRIFSWLQRPQRRAPAVEPAAYARRVRWAVVTAAHHSPFEMVCFPQAIAAALLLRRQGIASVLHYGVLRDESEALHAHTWLDAAGMTVVGGEAAAEFTPVASFASAPYPRP
jgi:hypothetical protein